MSVPKYLIAVAAIAALGTAAAAEPSRAPVRKAAQPAETQAPVVVAAAGAAATPAQAAGSPASTPAKPVRTARISSCRCGGQTPAAN